MKNSSSRKAVLVLAVLLLAFSRQGFGHTTGLSTSQIRFGTNGLEGTVIFAGADLRLALQQLHATAPFDRDQDGKLSEKEVTAGFDSFRKFAEGCLAMQFDDRPVAAVLRRMSLDDQDNFHLELAYPGPRPGRLRVRAALFTNLPPDHLHFISVHRSDGVELGKKMMNPGDDTLEVDCADGAATDQRPSKFIDFLKLGVEHIWTGYDHLLFLLALLLVCRDFKSAVQVVTCFTIAHSITLALASLNLAWISGQIVEPMIAASIIYVGAENLVRPDGPKGRWLITFLFGLIHGFGFASVLKDLGVASTPGAVGVPLLAFNLGVEVGQIVIAAVALPLLWQLRKTAGFQRWGLPAGSGLVAAMGAYWFVQRVFFNS